MLLESWAEHLTYPKLRTKLLDDWKAEYGGMPGDPVHPSRRADVVLIEEKGSGQSVVQDLRARTCRWWPTTRAAPTRSPERT
jgi:hypothetical protein